MSEIWAKSAKQNSQKPVLLSEHIKDTIDCFREFKNMSNRKNLMSAIETAIICHDFGKTFPSFQRRTLGNLNYSPSYIYNNLPHSLLSILLINQEELKDQGKLKNQTDEDENFHHIILSAIAYHHWREDFIRLTQESEEIGKLCDELKRKDFIKDLEENLKKEIAKVNSEWGRYVQFQDKIAEGLKNGVPFYKYATPPYQLYWLPKRLELDQKRLKDWILIAGFLQRCDHFASYCEEEGVKEKPEIEGVDVKVIKQKICSKLGDQKEEQIWQLKKIKDNYNKNLILIAPTGYGKTEFAFLWSNSEKFFYTLPLRTAVNQIYDRACKIFNENNQEKVGLLHSDADVFLLGDGGETQANFRSYELAKQLALPVIISTGDQFFPYALRPPGYEKIYATFSYSRLVIDEVQAYNPEAAAIIVKFIEDIVHLGGKFLLMTATLPSFVKNEIKNRIKDNFEEICLYNDDEIRKSLEKMKKHKVKVTLIKNSEQNNRPDYTLPEDEIHNILDKAKEGKRVLVIANTVKQAQDIFSQLKEKITGDNTCTELKNKIWLLHSRFTLAKRKELEEIICGNKGQQISGEFENPKKNSEKEGKILVATQIVEASLDIDADVLFTEIAPIDVLIQRMGRVLRRYIPVTPGGNIPEPSEPNVYVWMYKNGVQSGGSYVYDNVLIYITLHILHILKNPNESNKKLKDWEDLLNEIFNGKQSFEVAITELSKYEFVEKLYKALYEALPENNPFLEKFTKTLDILDAGYMSDRKDEAQEVFRKIYDYSIVPSTKRDEFISEVKNFFKKGNSKQLYSLFKRDVLSKFVVQVFVKSAGTIEDFKSKRIENWFLEDKEFWENEELKQYLERLTRWCSNIYYSELYDYDETLGVKYKDSANVGSGAFIL